MQVTTLRDDKAGRTGETTTKTTPAADAFAAGDPHTPAAANGPGAILKWCLAGVNKKTPPLGCEGEDGAADRLIPAV